MHNVTPHTDTSLSELMFIRMIRDKISNVQDIAGEVHDSRGKDIDCLKKYKGKVAADKRRAAKEIDIKVGDQALKKNVVFSTMTQQHMK